MRNNTGKRNAREGATFQMGDWIFFAAIAAFLILVITPLREAAMWFFKGALIPVLAAIKTIAHVIIRAHFNVIRNFAPRTRIYYELNRRRTSHTEDQ
jgi:hypothetical protein